MILAIATVLLSVLASAPAPADVSGRWEGTLVATRSDGTTSNDNVLLILTQKDDKITGTVGGADNDQHPITAGTIKGDKVVLTARHAENGREYHVELTLSGDELNGIVTSGDMRADVRTKRSKP